MSPEFVVVGLDPGFLAVGQVPEAVGMVYAHPSPGLAQVAQFTDCLS
jgi:hypothetical protein